MASRLDRLFVLLDSGSSTSTRKAAAQQIGQVQKVHPHELPTLLRSVHVYLRSASWDTRIAAGQAVEAIAENVPAWQPVATQGSSTHAESTEDTGQVGRLAFGQFSVEKLLRHGQPLLAAARNSAEYDAPSHANNPALVGLDRKQQAARLRQQAMKRLGMDVIPGGVSASRDLFDDEDLLNQPVPSSPVRSMCGQDAGEAGGAELADTLSNLSQRERHRAKRKAKLLARQSSNDVTASSTVNGSSAEGPAAKRVRLASSGPGSSADTGDASAITTTAAATAAAEQVSTDEGAAQDVVDEDDSHPLAPQESKEWPFESFCDELCQDLFHPSWTIRHGAATGLREIIKAHGSTAGLSVDFATDKWPVTNLAWLEDMALRLISMLVLDRFGDYVSDEVVAPVRETSAQTLGVVLRLLDAHGVQEVLKVLLQLLHQDAWQVRHGGLLAIKYMMVVRQEVIRDVLVTAWPGLLSGLGDMSEDVRAVAAAALLPVVDDLTQTLPQQVGPLLEVLWGALLELDDLTSSTHNVMLLLSALMTVCGQQQQQQRLCSLQQSQDDSKPAAAAAAAVSAFDLSSLSTPMPDLVLRCFPFLRHPSKAVRQSTLRTLQTLLALMSSSERLRAASVAIKSEPGDGAARYWMSLDTLSPLMCHLFQAMLLDGETDIHDEVEKTWRMTVSCAPAELVNQIALTHLPNWICLWLSATSMPLDTSLLLLATAQQSSAGGLGAAQDSKQPLSVFIGGLLGTESLAEQDQQACVVRLRVARLFATLAGALQERRPVVGTATMFTALQGLLQSLLRSNSAVARWAAAYMLASWASLQKPELEPSLQTDLLGLAGVSAAPVYDEVCGLFNTVQNECKRLVLALQAANVPLPDQPSMYTAESAAQLGSTALSVYCQQLSATAAQPIQRQGPSVLAAAGRYQEFSQATHARVQLCVACCLVQLGVLPDKLNPVIRPTMETIKQEADPLFKRIALDTLFRLLQHCAARSPCPNAKILRNLITMATRDQLHTPNFKAPLNAYVTLVMRHSAAGSSGFTTPSTPLTPAPAALTSALALASAAPLSAGPVDRNPAGIFPSVEASCDQFDGVLTLSVQQLVSSSVTGRRTRTLSSPVHSITMATTAMSSTVTADPVQLSTLLASADPADQTILQRIGSQQALQHLCAEFGDQLPLGLPAFWDMMMSLLEGITSPLTEKTGLSDDVMNQLMTSLQLCEICVPQLHSNLLVKFECVLNQLFNCLLCAYTSVRHMACRVLAALANRSLAPVMQGLMDRLSLLANEQVACYRCGLVESIMHIVDAVRLSIVPYVVLLIVPVLSRMSDQNAGVRLSASLCFATLIRLMPLESGVANPAGMSAELVARRDQERHFLEQLLDGSHVDDFQLPCAVEAELRKYQQDGVNWLAFLRKYNLHGILCDDMGLGKTLQTICIVVSDHYLQQQDIEAKQEQRKAAAAADDAAADDDADDDDDADAADAADDADADAAADDDLGTEHQPGTTPAADDDSEDAEKERTEAPLSLPPLIIVPEEAPSLVVCPPTLTGHWCAEVEKFCGSDGVLRVLHYMGDVRERTRLRSLLPKCNLVVSSYDIVRNDLEFFKSVHWNYCVLDEGHVIKSNKTKITKAVKSLQASHRLILSGTPIQNNVLELWSLFDFLMPGFLGSERQFLLRYGRPIINSRDAKSSSKEQEAGALAMEALHRQVLPFILRRMKDDVLHDLPPKIIQDYCCQLSPLQVRLYQEFSASRGKAATRQPLDEEEQHEDDGTPALSASATDGVAASASATDGVAARPAASPAHAFQLLQYLQKVCNHPSLVLTPKHPSYSTITAELAEAKSSLHDISHACKLVALKQLLLDCGLGHGGGGLHSETGAGANAGGNAADILDGSVVSCHRVLLFCQQKSVLDLIENDLFKPHLPSISYLRLDGNTPATERHGLVTRFNNDASIDVLLLTTHVGGLGLNLTGADTVIFMEHDWNPMKDLQAMDRAHRIGQKKVVNVYRLVTRGTMEERIMSLQKFKLGVANSVVTADNASMSSMDTHQLLDLFQADAGGSKASGGGGGGGTAAAAPGSLKAALEGLDDLWDKQDYDAEYNMDSFVQSLK